MRIALLILFLFPAFAYGQDLIELGKQTTKRGLFTYRSGIPTTKPIWKVSRDTNPVVWVDTLNQLRYDWNYKDDVWYVKGVSTSSLPPLPTFTSGATTIDNRTSLWRPASNVLHRYDHTLTAWVPLSLSYQSAAPTEIASGVGNGAATYRKDLWIDSDDNILYYWNGSAWTPVGADNWGTQSVVRDSSLTGWGVTANPLGIKGYAAASNGQVPSKSTGGITWVSPYSLGRDDSSFVKINGSYLNKRITSNLYRNGTTGFGTTDTTGRINVVAPSSRYGIYFPSTETRYLKFQKESGASSQITSFNVVRSFFPSASTAGDNQVVSMGFNVNPDATLEDVTEAGMRIGFENNYRNSGGDPRQFEFHFPEILYPGGALRRPISGIYSNDASIIKGGILFTGDRVDLYDYKTATQKAIWTLAENEGTKGVSALDTFSLLMYKNNVGGIFQRNAANSSFVRGLMVDNSDRVLLGGQGESRIAAYNILQVTNSGLVWNENGELLVGNSSNKTNLTVYGTNGNVPLTITGGASARSWAFEVGSSAFALRDVTSGGTPMYFYNSSGTGDFIFRNSNLGIGGVPGFFPEAKLHVYSSSGATAKLIRLENSTGFNDIFRSTATPEGAITSDPGGVAITNVSSTGKLFLKVTGTGNTGWLEMNTGAAVGGSGVVGQIPYFNTTSTITTEAGSGANSNTWDPTNNRLGVAVASPTKTLDVGGDIQGSADLYLGAAFKIYNGGALYKHEFGSTSNFIGLGSGNLTNTGVGNNAYGRNTLQALTSGTGNTALGDQALKACTTCASVVAIGPDAALAATTATNSVFNGRSSGAGVTIGTANVGIGHLALGAGTTTQGNNTAIGFLAGYGNSLDYTVAIGSEAGESGGSRSQSSYTGAFSGYGATGSNHTFNGFYSGLNQTGSNTTYTGVGAGFGNTTSNTWGIDNNTGFASNHTPDIGGNSSTNYAGVNTAYSALAAAWQVTGTGTTSGTYGLIVTNSGGATATASMVVRDDGNTGFGTNAPSQKLHVVGSIRATVGAFDSANSDGNNGDILKSDGTNWLWASPSSLGLGKPTVYRDNANLKAGGTTVGLDSGSLRLTIPNVAAIKYGLVINGGTSLTASRFLAYNAGADSFRIDRVAARYTIKNMGGSIPFMIGSDNFLEFSADSVDWIEGTVATAVSTRHLMGLADNGFTKRMEGIDDTEVLMWDDTLQQYESRMPGKGKYFVSGASSQTLGGAHFLHRADANANTVTLTVGSAMLEWRHYILECSRNNTNGVNLTAESGFFIKWSSDGTLPGDATVLLGAGGAGLQSNFGVYLLVRVGSIIYVK